MIQRLLQTFCSILFLLIFAQEGSIKGFVKSKASSEPVLFASVSLEGTPYGVSTDVNGYYSLTKVPVGTYTLVVTSVEYQEMKVEVQVTANKVISKNLFVEDRVVTLD
ncbi:MAG: carboxypeptidase-like regulatory domain-containing protein, partial [Flavobacteriales bacterium]|nr:carboxypeptidase-like regulatory domain-containing protein [Flavobacteriales bacterium]